ncbi:uncharacterized protein LOC144113438 isoform X2 [Amblyomma americanum]
MTATQHEPVYFTTCPQFADKRVLQNTAVDAKKVFDVNSKVKDFIRKLERQHKTKVSWWDMYGKQRWLVDRGDQYKKYQVTAKADPMTLDAESNRTLESDRTVKSYTVYVNRFENHQPDHEQKTLIRRTTRREKEVSWFSTKSINIDVDVRATLSLFGVFNLGGSFEYSYDLRSGERHVEKEVEEFSIEKEITIPPRSTVEVEWVITETVESCPWKSDVVLDGWFAIWFERPVQRHHLWFHPIDAVRDPDLKLHDPSGVVYTTEGFAVGVTTVRNDLRVRQYSHEGPQNETIYAVPLNESDVVSTTLIRTPLDDAEDEH